MAGLWREIVADLRQVAARRVPVAGVSVDSWGLDYVLMRAGEPQIGLPFCYRDPRTDAPYSEVLGNGHAPEIFATTGIQFLQECRGDWAQQEQYFSGETLTRLAAEAEPLRSLIHPNDPRFARPDRMPDKIREFCRETGRPVPETPGQVARCVLESLALLYRQVLETLEELTGVSVEVLHIVGGGSQSALLNQFAANATGRKVLAGPVEASAVGVW